jgi:hypothetical protein
MEAALLLLHFVGPPAARPAEPPAWAEPARRTHARFTGRPGTLALFGDSITVSQAFWSPLRGVRRNASPALEQAVRRVSAHLRPECWRDWRGPEYGNDGGQKVAWADAHVAEWLRKLNPEAAVILFGTNDLPDTPPDDYRTKLRAVVRRCLDNGTVVLLTTVPPRHGFEKKAEQFAKIARQVADDLHVPVIDYYAEILKRRPHDWDGAADAFGDYKDYEVSTLLARDGVHPSFPKKYQDDYSDEALGRSGYTLRNYLTVLRYAEVLAVLSARDAPRPKPSGAALRFGPG